MAYSNNPYKPKARAAAMKLLLYEQLPVQVVAIRSGVNRTTIWRWKQKWLDLNKNVQFSNPNRPSRPPSLKNKLRACRWQLATLSSRPHQPAGAIAKQIVQRVLELRKQLKRCAEVIWHHLNHLEGIKISLSSVRRILKRHHCFKNSRKNRVRPDNPRRPLVTEPGQLVQTDTIHYVCILTGRRRYVYTVIDLYTRMTYAQIHDRIEPKIAAKAVLKAESLWGFKIAMIQADNGPEFSRYFEQVMTKNNCLVRHSRLGRPNDNAHIERFNRTIQQECLGRHIYGKTTNPHLQTKINQYIEHYNNHRVHLGLQLKIPAQMLQSF